MAPILRTIRIRDLETSCCLVDSSLWCQRSHGNGARLGAALHCEHVRRDYRGTPLQECYKSGSPGAERVTESSQDSYKLCHGLEPHGSSRIGRPATGLMGESRSP